MKRTWWLLLILVSVFSLSACNGHQVTTPTPTPISFSVTSTPLSPMSSDSGLNLLVVAEGEVELKRDGWSEYRPTALGAMLRRGDVMRLSDNAKVVILCDNLNTWDVPAGALSGLNGCPQPEEPLLIRHGTLIHNSRQPSEPFIPYIISPRMTRLLTDQPRLRWNEVAGASSYTVSLQGVKWEAQLNDTEIVYPGDPPLERGRSYLLTIVADNGTKSTDEEPTRLGFVLLSPEEAETVQTYTTTINGLNLPDESKALALAHLYAEQGLVAEAIEILEPFAENGTQTAATYRLLGDLYRQIGLPLLAEGHYVQAITLSEAINDLEGQAAAQAALGEVYASLNNKQQAIHWLSEAQSGYEILGDIQRVIEIASLLEELE
ncbi:MAG: tetratricopeptide repeat protein [Ardenticatenaceae bacterium]